LEAATLPCDLANESDPEEWDWNHTEWPDEPCDELIDRGLVVELPCVACTEMLDIDIAHIHITAKGVEALKLYREHPELLE
jgi:hypothetical protein